MVTKAKEEIWSTLKSRVTKALEEEKISLSAVFSELTKISKTLVELAEMKKDYYPDQLEPSVRNLASIGQIQRNWNFVTSLEEAIRKTTQQKLVVKKKERAIRDQCSRLESEVKKYQTLEDRAIEKQKKSEALKEGKAADEMAAAYWLRQKIE